MIKKFKISIIIPTFNSERYLYHCLNSVIKNDYDNYEVIIIDNASTDSTEQIVKNFKNKKFRFFKNDKNYERAYSRNRGISLAAGDYITFLDSDDYLKYNIFSKLINFINKKNLRDEIFYARYSFKKNNIQKKSRFKEKQCTFEEMSIGNNLPNIGLFVPINICKKVLYDENRHLIGFEDYDFSMRLIFLKKKAFLISEEPLCIINNHSNRSMHTKKKENTLDKRLDYFVTKIKKNRAYSNLSKHQKNKIIGVVLIAICEEFLMINKKKKFIRYFLKSIQKNFSLILTYRFLYLLKKIFI